MMNPILTNLNDSLNTIVAQTQLNLPILGAIVLVLLGVFLLSRIVPSLLYLGIRPRHASGLVGVLFAPLLHADFNHLFFNSIPLIVLSNFLLIHGLPYFLGVTLFIAVSSGALVWCFGKSGLHIGASALITGYWSFLVSNIVYEGSMMAIILGLISVYYFAGIFFSVFPSRQGISWEGHLFGLLSGIALSYLIHF